MKQCGSHHPSVIGSGLRYLVQLGGAGLILVLALPSESLAQTSTPTTNMTRKTYGKRAQVGLEFAPGVAIPFKKYLDFGSSTSRYSMDNGPGFGFGLSLLLNRFEIRWGYSRLASGTVDGKLPDKFVQDFEQLLGKQVEQTIHVEAPDPLVFHSLSFGYRLTFAIRHNVHLSFPLALGPVIASPPAFGMYNYNLFGLGANAGIHAEYLFRKCLALGGGARFSAYVTEPDPNLAGAGLIATQNLFDNVIAWIPLLSIGIHARIYY